MTRFVSPTSVDLLNKVIKLHMITTIYLVIALMLPPNCSTDTHTQTLR